MGGIVSSSYAAALLEIAKREKKLKEYKEQLKDIEKTLSNSQDIVRVMEYPWISKQDKKKILGKVFDCEIYVMNLLYLLVDKSRFNSLKEICRDFIADANELLNIEVVVVTSAYALTKGEVTDIRRMLEKKRGKAIELIQIIDPSCIAGIRLKIKDLVMENTAAGRLEAIKQLAAKADIQSEGGESHEAEA